MSDINSNITLCYVNISPTHQLLFKDSTEQQQFFTQHKVANGTRLLSYSGANGYIRVQGYVDTINANYVMMRHTYGATEKNYFYYIVGKKALSKETTELTVAIDVFQTWMFDITFQDCFIERGHVSDDTLGANTVPESFELGDYVTNVRSGIDWLTSDPCFFMAVTDPDQVDGGKFGKNYSGFSLYYYAYGDDSKMTSKINEICTAGKEDAINFIFTFPSEFAKKILPSGIKSGYIISGYDRILEKVFSFTNFKTSFNYGTESYTPYNKKLLTYPFNMMVVFAPTGGNVVLKPELFSNVSKQSYNIECVLGQNPTISCTPQNYNGVANDDEDSIAMQGYGLCSWANDNYANWFAQHENSINAQSENARASYNASADIASRNYGVTEQNTNASYNMGQLRSGVSAGMGAISTLTGNIGGGINTMIGAGMNAIENSVNRSNTMRSADAELTNNLLLNNTNYQNQQRALMAQVKDASVQPNTCKGDTSASGLDLTRGSNTFYIKQMSIKPEFAKKIDLYFQMYGYQINEIASPRKYMNTRSKWNYIKTVGCVVTGNVPKDHLDLISAMFDNGLTLWHSYGVMYHYNTTNNIL